MKTKFFCKIFLILFSAFVPFAMTSCATMQVLSDTFISKDPILGSDKGSVAKSIIGAGSSIVKAAEQITPENEYYIGRSVAATILTNYKTYENPQQEIYLNKICRTITEKSSRTEIYNGYHVKILDTNEVNAFATSGGHIFVTCGLINCAKSEDALASVIAHEVSHIQLKHSIKAIKTSRWTKAGINSLDALVAMSSEEAAGELDNTVNDIISNMVNSGYSKRQEYDADKTALTLMQQAGYNPHAMLDFLQVLQIQEKKSSTGFSKTHPSASSRLSKVKEELKKLPASEDTSEFRAERFQGI